MQEQKIYGRREGSVGHLVFNNPAKLNAVSLDMWDAFVGILKDYEKDPEVLCVVLSGAGGKAFVSGADISKFESERANAEAQVRYDAISREGYEGLYNFSKPTIAKVTGYCIGGGLLRHALLQRGRALRRAGGQARARLWLHAHRAPVAHRRPAARHGVPVHRPPVLCQGGL
jgi:1,4-dihydroxy-2-naphthoyl-CoA synthase